VKFLLRRIAFPLLVLSAPLMVAPRADAVTVSDLRDHYFGPGYSTKDPALEEHKSVGLDVLSRGTGGKFTGLLAGVPFSSKVSAQGKVAFTTKFNGMLGGEPGQADPEVQRDFERHRRTHGGNAEHHRNLQRLSGE
jgi:hypothetical protein